MREPGYHGLFRKQAPAGATTRELLSANRTYFVRTDGSDSNNGLTNSAGGAFLTIQKAVDTVYSLDLNGKTVTIQVVNTSSPSTFTAQVAFSGHWTGKGTVALLGDATTPANVVISTTGQAAIVLSNGAHSIMISGFKIQTTSGGSGLVLQSGARATLNGLMEFGACTGASINISGGSQLIVSTNYTLSGGGAYHVLVEQLSGIDSSGRTVTITGTPNFSQAFIWLQNMAFAYYSGATMSGSATGKRFDVSMNSVLNTGGAGANFFPGNSAGTPAPGTTPWGGQYV